MANNHSGIRMPADQQASSPRRQTHVPLTPHMTRAGRSTGAPLGTGMNASVGSQAQIHTAPISNPLSQRFGSISVPVPIQRRPQNRQPTVNAPNAPPREPGLPPALPIVSDRRGAVSPEEPQPATPPVPAPGPVGQRESAAVSQQQQDQQPTEVRVPTAGDPGPSQVRRPSQTPAPSPQREQQQAATPAPAPGPVRQRESAAANQQQQDQQPAEVRVATARDLGRRTRPTQRQPHHSRPNNTYSPEPHYIENPPANERGTASYIPNPMPWIHAIFNAVGNWICTPWARAKRIFKRSGAVLKFLTTIMKWCLTIIVKWFLSVLTAVINIIPRKMILLAVLVGWIWHQRVGEIVCSPINSFCEYQYNLLGPIMCPVAMCMADPHPSTLETVAAPPSLGLAEVVPEGDREARLKDSEYIRSLFRIPYALDWARKSLKEQPFYIQMSSMPDKEKNPHSTTLERIILDMETMTRGLQQFNLDYIHAVRIIHGHVRLFEGVFIKIIDDYAGSTSPDKTFLRYHYHHTSAGGSWERINALMRRVWMLTNEGDGDGAETVNATTELQVRFEEFVNSSIFPLQSLDSSAHDIRSALSPLQKRLTDFSVHAADSLHNDQNEEKDKKDTGGGLSYSLGNWFQETEMERARKKNEIEFPWIGADTAFLGRCEGDLMDALRVLDGVNSRISNAEIAIEHLGRRLHELSEKDMHDGWGSASVKILTQELKGFMRWMDGGGVDLDQLNKEAEEEEYKKWNKPMSLWY